MLFMFVFIYSTVAGRNCEINVIVVGRPDGTEGHQHATSLELQARYWSSASEQLQSDLSEKTTVARRGLLSLSLCH